MKIDNVTLLNRSNLQLKDDDLVELKIRNSKGILKSILIKLLSFKETLGIGDPIETGTVTQLTSIATAVTLNKQSGVVTTVSSTLTGDSFTGFNINNSLVTDDSVVLLTTFYQGSGTPIVNLAGVFDGTISIRINNAHPSQALNTILKIHFYVVN